MLYFHILVKKNKILYKLLSAENNLMGRLALLKYAEDQQLVLFRKVISDAIVQHELLQSLNS